LLQDKYTILTAICVYGFTAIYLPFHWRHFCSDVESAAHCG